MKRILLLGCGGSAGINFVKALNLDREKFYIVGIDKNKYYLEMSPVNKRYLVNHKKGEEKLYVEKINEVIKRENIDFIHAQPDPEVKILSDFRSKINTRTFLPLKETVDICQDKWLTYEVLHNNKIPVAKTVQILNHNTLREVFEKNNDTLWIRAKKGAGGSASLAVKRYEHARMWIEYWVERGLQWTDFLVNEYLPGKEISWLSVWNDGELVCSQQKQRHEWVQGAIAPSGVGGTTAIQKTVQSELINKISTNTILAIDKKPQGVFVVDTKENEKKIPCVTEINVGRFFTTSLFFATAGVNMPAIYTKLGLHLPIEQVQQYNCVPKNIYWIRVADGGPTMVKNEEWSSEVL